MNIILKLWNFFNGKKTVIGAVLLFLAEAMEKVLIGIWHVDAPWILPAIATLKWAGMAFVGGGVWHKLTKPGANSTNAAQ